MDQTDPCRFPYPQCDPPLTEDASDIAQLRDLAVAVDTYVQGLYDRAGDLLNTPDAAVLVNGATQIANEVANLIALPTVEFDNTPGGTLADQANNQFLVRQTGIYYLNVAVRIDSPSATLRPSLSMDINGLITGLRGQTIATSTIEGALGVFDVRALTAGDRVRFRWNANTNFSVNLSGARAGIWRMA